MEVIKVILTGSQQMGEVITEFRQYPPTASAFDTEATSLHIIDGRPFIIQFGWYNEEAGKLFSYAIDMEATPEWKQMVQAWYVLAKESPVYLAHNVKYDLHMKYNAGVPYFEDNLSDSMFYIRAANDNISPRNGGVILSLKSYTKKYISKNADRGDKLIQKERAKIAKKYNLQLRKDLGWLAKEVDAFFKDKINTLEDLPNIQDYIAYTNWKKSLPEGLQHVRGTIHSDDVPYNLVDRKLMMDYALDDIVWVLLVHRQTLPIIKARGTYNTVETENSYIVPLWKMERQGLDIDQVYVKQAYVRMKRYIKKRRQELMDLVGSEITAYQNAKFKDYLHSKGVMVQGTGDEVLARIHIDYPGHEVNRAVDCIRELRTLEKWLTTYLYRMMDHDRLYTQLNQVGAASLRMSSDFQQFPKGGIVDADGNELFNPRRAIKPPEGKVFVYIDYSQIELRVQALYTILLGEPDLNLCRAFMPYKCYRKQALPMPIDPLERGTTVPFDFNNKERLTTFSKYTWYQEEDDEEWHPVDVHGATTKAAFNIMEDHEDYKSLRSMGKRVNFAKNYGASITQITIMFPDATPENIRKIDSGYYKAFPSILKYHKYCEQLALSQGYATNLFGIRYWNVTGHNLKNMLIQGSSATFLKMKIKELDDYLSTLKDTTIDMVLPVHDEIQFTMDVEELHRVPTLVKIMEQWEDSLIPIVADTEITYTNWADKEDLHV